MPDGYFPIEEVTPYHKNWTICARVLTRSQTRTWDKKQADGQKNAGQVFSVDLIDQDGGEIRASFFNDAVTKFNFVEPPKVFKFSKGLVKVANKAYNQQKHEYEIQFNGGSVVEAVEDDGSIGTIASFDFSNLRELRTRPLPCNIDVIGVVNKVEETRTWTKNGVQYTKYQFTVVDETETELDVSVFGETAKKYPREALLNKDGYVDEKNPKIVALKGVAVKEFQGRSGVFNDTGAFLVDPKKGKPGDRSKEIEKWWKSGGSSKAFVSMREAGAGQIGGNQVRQVNLGELVDEIEPASGENKEQFIITEAYARMMRVLTQRKDEEVPQWYEACPEKVVRANAPANAPPATCNKKVRDGVCPTHGLVTPVKRWLVRAVFQDGFGDSILNLFDDDMKKLTGKTAQDASEMQITVDEWFKSWQVASLYKLRLRSYKETYEGDTRSATRILAIEPVNIAKRTDELLKAIYDDKTWNMAA
ncbi:unnamed protein product [Amoebophrya sp. A120]|nr:unnamed protein product [Amoebophrya sp. A120]|eukprot:GSA120T00017918001.1